MRRIDVFFYGLFMDRALLRAKGAAPRGLRPAEARGFELRIGERATLVTSNAGRVHGMLASLSHAELDRLYSEPTLKDYRPEAVIVSVPGGDPVPARCYKLVEPPSGGEHNPEYAARLRALAQELGFPADYVASIR
jgi:Gamma-glutamyl cyclotransferase, AIG2-like